MIRRGDYVMFGERSVGPKKKQGGRRAPAAPCFIFFIYCRSFILAPSEAHAYGHFLWEEVGPGLAPPPHEGCRT